MSTKIKQILFLVLILTTIIEAAKCSGSCTGTELKKFSGCKEFEIKNENGDIAFCKISVSSAKDKSNCEKMLTDGENKRLNNFNKRKPMQSLNDLGIKECEIIHDQQEIEADIIAAAAKKLDEGIGLPDEQQKTMDSSDLKKEHNDKLSSSSNVPNDCPKSEKYCNINEIFNIDFLNFFLIVAIVAIVFSLRKNKKLSKELSQMKKLEVIVKMKQEQLAEDLIDYLKSFNKSYEKSIDIKSMDYEVLLQAKVIMHELYKNKYDDPEKIIAFLNHKSSNSSNKISKESLQVPNYTNVQTGKDVATEPLENNNLQPSTEILSKSDVIPQQENSEIVQPEAINILYFPMPNGDIFKAVYGSNEFKEGISLYRFEIVPKTNTALIFVENRQSVVQRITSSPRTQDGVCEDEDGSYFEDATQIITKTPGSAILKDDKWRITDKIKIKYE